LEPRARIGGLPGDQPFVFSEVQFIEMHTHEISYASNREFGVQVAPIIIVSLDSVKTAIRGRRGTSGSCYNRCRINDLGNETAGVKMEHYFHRYLMGAYVKWIAPQSRKSLNGTSERKQERKGRI
jgi:hypothetical protein